MKTEKNYETLEISGLLSLVLDQLGSVAIFDKNFVKTPSHRMKNGDNQEDFSPDLQR